MNAGTHSSLAIGIAAALLTMSLTDSTALGQTCSCLGDFNLDGQIDGGDLGTLLGYWGSSAPGADLDGNGLVDGGDLGSLLGLWGPCGPPANDLCANARWIGPGVYPFCTNFATTDGPALPPNSCGEATQIDGDLWYLFAPAGDGVMSLRTCGAAFDTVIAVYSSALPGIAPCPTSGPGISTFVGCNDDGPPCVGFGSSLTLNVAGGKLYRIRVGGYNIAQFGSGTLTLDFTSVGDSCQNPVIASSVSSFVTVFGNTSDNPVTALPGTCLGANPGRAEWVSYTCLCTGTYLISTCNPGTDFDTMLNVMQHQIPGPCAGMFLACNDDSPLDGCQIDGFNRKSFVQVTVQAATMLRIAVSGWNGASGNYELTIQRICN